MRSGFRYSPPRVEVTAELRWLLWHAFGPPDDVLPGAEGMDGEAVTDLARRFDLAARVGAKISSESLAAGVDWETLAWFRTRHAEAAARFLLAVPVCRELAERARLLEIPLVFLKGAALQLGEKVAPGSRNMGDIDVLAPESGAKRLQSALVESGCAALGTRESEHQLQYLTHRSGFGIEIHKTIPGVRLGGGSSVTADELIREGLVQPVPSLEGECYLPSDDIVLAHVTVHGIAQHGLAPGAYPMSRMLADVQDLGAPGDVWEAASRWIERDVSRQEMEAVGVLIRRLGGGSDPKALVAGDDAAGAMLRHILAGVLEDSYAKSLKFRGLTAKPKDMGTVRSLGNILRGALLPTRAQIDILYGPPRSELGYWGWRLWRPFDLGLRTVRYGGAWVRQRFWRRRR